MKRIEKAKCNYVLSFLVFLFSCKTEEKYFAYRIQVYSIIKDSIKLVTSPSDVISYKPYIFEYKKTIVLNDTIYGNPPQKVQLWSYDTTGIYLLNPAQSKFVEFDGLKEEAIIKNSGKFSEKKFEQGLRDSIPPSPKLPDSLKLRDTMVWGRSLFYLPQTIKYKNGKDSLILNTFFVKNPHFISLYDITSGKFPDPNYSIVGFVVTLVEQKQTLLMKLEELRPLTKKEKMICEELIKKSGFK